MKSRLSHRGYKLRSKVKESYHSHWLWWNSALEWKLKGALMAWHATSSLHSFSPNNDVEAIQPLGMKDISAAFSTPVRLNLLVR
jgi:hypothetical protein